MAAVLNKARSHLSPNDSYELVEGHYDQNEELSGGSRIRSHGGLSAWWKRFATIRYGFAAIAVLLFPLIVFGFWIPHSISRGIYIGFVSDAIGGSFTQTEAKAIDVLCSALLGPLLLVAFNKLWFTNARVTMIDQSGTGRRHISLLALVEACITDSGSYDIFKISRLVASGHPRLVFFGLLVFLSAVAKTSFSNMIAYEAFEAPSTEETVTNVSSLGFVAPGGPVGYYNFNDDQKAYFHLKLIGMYAALSYQDATSLLTNGTYIGINATKTSMNGLHSKYTELKDVPGYRLTLDCRPAVLKSMIIWTAVNAYQTSISTNTTDNVTFTGHYPGQPSILTNNASSRFDYLAFNSGPTEQADALLLRFMAGNWEGYPTMNTSYGSLPIKAFNLANQVDVFKGDKSVWSFTGVRCRINRETGKLKLTRNTNLTWSISDTVWDGRKKGSSVLLYDWQLTPRFLAPNGFQPGIGPALAGSAAPSQNDCPVDEITRTAECQFYTDFEKSALNYLYAVGEGERILYETMDGNYTGLKVAHYYGPMSLQAMVSSQRYRITYIPLILFIGLVSMLLAALIPLSLLMHTWKTKAVRDWRMLDTLRLVVDAVTGLRQDDAINTVKNEYHSSLDDWAGRFNVRYELGNTTTGMQPELRSMSGAANLRNRGRDDHSPGPSEIRAI